jgi:hypothetical protein
LCRRTSRKVCSQKARLAWAPITLRLDGDLLGLYNKDLAFMG